MIISEHEFLDRAQLDRETLEVWIDEEWLVPSGTATGVVCVSKTSSVLIW
jgi:hypothetical protein